VTPISMLAVGRFGTRGDECASTSSLTASGVDGAASASGAAHETEYQAGSGNAKRTLPRADFALYAYLYDLVVEP
jgi:hypothetical protein